MGVKESSEIVKHTIRVFGTLQTDVANKVVMISDYLPCRSKGAKTEHCAPEEKENIE